VVFVASRMGRRPFGGDDDAMEPLLAGPQQYVTLTGDFVREQGIRLQVANALDDLDTAQASLGAAEKTREFAERRLKTEQKKYELGVTQLFFLLDSQTRFSKAENDALRESVNYRRALINLYLVTGEVLSRYGVMLN